jgi:hypothetical protein
MMMALPATLDLAGPLALLDDWPEEALATSAPRRNSWQVGLGGVRLVPSRA